MFEGQPDLIIFRAALQGAACLKLDGDGGGKVTLTVPDSEADAFRRLMDVRQQVLIVAVGVASQKGLRRGAEGPSEGGPVGTA